MPAIIDLGHPLVKLARTIDWCFLEQRFGVAYQDKPGRPPLPTRLMAGLCILKHSYDLSDEALCERWVENPYYQFFCGEEFFQHRLVLDRSSLTRWRQRMGEEKLQALLQESLAVASKTEAIRPADLNRVIVDITVQPKNVMFPTDAWLLNRARSWCGWPSATASSCASRGRRLTTVRRVRPDLVVVAPPGCQHGARLRQAGEQRLVQTLVTRRAICR